MEPVPIPTQGANPYLINERVLVYLFYHYDAMIICVINVSSSDERFLVLKGLKESGRMNNAAYQTPNQGASAA